MPVHILCSLINFTATVIMLSIVYPKSEFFVVLIFYMNCIPVKHPFTGGSSTSVRAFIGHNRKKDRVRELYIINNIKPAFIVIFYSLFANQAISARPPEFYIIGHVGGITFHIFIFKS